MTHPQARLCLFLFSLLSALLFLMPTPQAEANGWGAVYYVAPTGNDANPGTEAQPWRTIQKAAQTLVAGDTVYIRAGTYNEQVVPQNSGTAGSYITYAAYPGEVATIDGNGIILPDDLAGLFEIFNQSYIRVSGLRLINAGPYNDNAAILVLNSNYITVENNTTYNSNSSGIGVWGSHNVIVDGNRIEESCGGGWQECITIAGTDIFEVRNNEVLNCYKEGLCVKDGAANGQVFGNTVHHTQKVGIYVDATDKHTHDIAVFQNVVHDITDSNGLAIGSEVGGLLENVQVYNNIAYHNRYVGLALHNCCADLSPSHPVRGIRVVNNTFYNNGWTVWGGGLAVDNPDLQDVVIRNNIVSQNLYFQMAVAAGVPAAALTIDHNLIDGYRGTEGEIYGDSFVEADPRFVDGPAANFHLQTDSPAIDAGSALNAPETDFDGLSRPLDGDGDGLAGYDIGAYEMP